jgi:DNA-binding NarL/FixJ family response regulator
MTDAWAQGVENCELVEKVRVLVVDDHPVVREGIKFMLQSSPRLQVVAEGGDGVEALEKVRSVLPDVVLIDIEMPNMGGINATKLIKEEFPKVSVVVMSVHDDALSIAESLQAGAVGYVLKHAPQEELCQAVEMATRGEVSVRASLLQRAFQANGSVHGRTRKRSAPSAQIPRVEELTAREGEVLALLAQGKTNKEIGECLYISTGTVKKHIESILDKLYATDRTDAAAIAVRLGLVK